MGNLFWCQNNVVLVVDPKSRLNFTLFMGTLIRNVKVIFKTTTEPFVTKKFIEGIKVSLHLLPFPYDKR